VKEDGRKAFGREELHSHINVHNQWCELGEGDAKMGDWDGRLRNCSRNLIGS